MSHKPQERRTSFSLAVKVARLVSSLKSRATASPPSPSSLPESPILSSSAPSSSPGSTSPTRSSSTQSSCQCIAPSPHLPRLEQSSDRSHTSPGMFQNASGFVISNSLFQDVTVVQPYLNRALELLSKHALTGPRFDLVEAGRPICHPETRLRIIENAQRFYVTKKIFWIAGPAGVGKTAIMRSISKSQAGRVGAEVYFSRPNKRTDSRCFVQTIAYQLAVRIPKYQEYVLAQLTADPMLLDSSTRELFQTLIEIPFGGFVEWKEGDFWVILVDGLDECDGERAQCEIVELIGRFAQRFPSSPLGWVVASRPEYWLQAAFAEQDVKSNCSQEYIEINTPEARRDVEVYLQSEFKKIRSAFARQFSPSQVWPTPSQFRDLTKSASGLFLFANTASRFVEDPAAGNPINQLSILLAAIGNGGSSSGKENPLAPLHTLYSQIVDYVPQEMFASVTRRILGCCRLLPRNTIHATSFALSCNFLGITQHDAYSSLQRLHSVVEVPSYDDAAVKEMKILHSSFYEYLENQLASQTYHVSRQEAGADIVRCSFRILQEANSGTGPFPQPYRINLTWPHPQSANAPEMLLQTAYDGFRLLSVVESVPDQLSSSILAQADFSKLDCYLNPSVKSSVHKVRANHPIFFEWLIEKYKAKPEAFKDFVTDHALWKVRTPLIRLDRTVIHFRFVAEGKHLVVRPRVYSGSEEVRKRYGGESLEPFKEILRSRRLDSPTSKVQVWGRNPNRSCILFQCDRSRTGDRSIVKELFFIPYHIGRNTA